MHKRAWWVGLAAGVLLLLITGLTLGVSFPLEREDQKMYPTAENPADFYGRVYAKTRIKAVSSMPVTSLAHAGELAGFLVHLPTLMPDGLSAMPVTATMVMGAHAYEIGFDLNQARALLQAGGMPTEALPEGLDGVQVTVTVPPGAVSNQTRETRFVTLLQGRTPVVMEPGGADPALLDTLAELGLRCLGLSATDARQLVHKMGWAWFLVLPPAEMDVAEPMRIAGRGGLALRSARPGRGITALLWEADGVLYGLYGNVPVTELLPVAESVR